MSPPTHTHTHTHTHTDSISLSLKKQWNIPFAESSLSDLCFFTRFEGEVLQDSDKGEFHARDRKPHPNAVSRSSSKRQVYIRIYAVLVLLTEPGSTIQVGNKLGKHKNHKSYLFRVLNQGYMGNFDGLVTEILLHLLCHDNYKLQVVGYPFPYGRIQCCWRDEVNGFARIYLKQQNYIHGGEMFTLWKASKKRAWLKER